jgi:hypothetical protein
VANSLVSHLLFVVFADFLKDDPSMNDKWYIGRDEEEYGPFTAAQLKELGTTGQVRPTDTIWREGMADPLPATKVKGLLPAAEAPAETPASSETSDEPAPRAAETPPPEPKTAADEKTALLARVQAEAKKKRVISAKGAVILGQDGKEVRFRKKCIKCGKEDRSSSKMPIRSGTTRTSFFCPNCRKLHPIEIVGV